MQPINPDTVLLLVANPVDILTHFARQISGLPANQVLGTGTSLDSARLRGRLARELEVAPNSVNAFVLGEHGDSQFVSGTPATVLGTVCRSESRCSRVQNRGKGKFPAVHPQLRQIECHALDTGAVVRCISIFY